MPGIVGLDQDEAAAELDRMGLTLTVAAAEHDFDRPAGEVLDQDPAEGAPLRRGGSVAVVVSSGRAPAPMPDVVEMTRDEALALLHGPDYRFEVRVDEEHSTAPAGQVQAQAPAEGTALTQGDAVVINVSLGVRQVAVPDLSGMDRDEAAGALADAGLRASFAGEYSDEFPSEGDVIRQSATAGTRIDENSVVTVTVSRGPASVKVPDVRGDPVAEAVAEVESAGLVARVESEPRPRLGPFPAGRVGRVEVQDPSPGTTVRRGSTVTLYTFTED